ncbi:MAG: LysR family transcriptional regulator [Blautia marasmi]
MNTVQLECYMAVAENLNFARAAEQLHITQPAVTHQINSLEAELDVKLFRRTTRTVELTAPGWVFGDMPRTSWQRQPRQKTDLPGTLKIKYSLLSSDATAPLS